MQPSSHPSIYRGRGKGGRPPLDGSRGGAAAKGEGACPPSKGGAPFRVPPNPRAHGPLGGGAPAHFGLVPFPLTAHEPLRERWPLPVDPRGPSGGPGTIPICPRTIPVSV